MKKLLVSLVTLGIILTVPGSIFESRVFGFSEYSAKVPGPGNPDVNGDGKVNSIDYVLVKRCILGLDTGDIVFDPDLDGDGRISSSDYAIIKRIILGKY